MLGIKEIKEIIPHRHPFLLVDCIEELEPGVRAVGYKAGSERREKNRILDPDPSLQWEKPSGPLSGHGPGAAIL